MPALLRLSLTQFRNLSSVVIYPSRTLNLITGENGSGKTSLIESISVLAHGRSFRTHKFRSIIQLEQDRYTVFGEVESQGETHKVGVEREKSGKNRALINGQSIKTAAELAQVIPLKVMDSHSFELLEGSASQRRRVLDWLVFHVEPSFKLAWRDYARCVKQRNILLRNPAVRYQAVASWDAQITLLAHQINQLRQSCLAKLQPVFNSLIEQTGFYSQENQITFEYSAGWRDAEDQNSLKELLEQNFDRDKAAGRTMYGAHRSDFICKVYKKPAIDILSRGQQKTVISALHIAQALVFKEQSTKSPVFLLDDLLSELDENNTAALLTWLKMLESQIFITGVDAHKIKSKWMYNNGLENDSTKVFHVKHGSITTQDNPKS